MTRLCVCSVDAALSNSPHTAEQPHPDWHIVTASGQEFYACDAHVASLLYFDGPNTVTSTATTERPPTPQRPPKKPNPGKRWS